MAAPEPARVLVVDDEPMVREVLTRYLAHDGFEVSAAGDGQAALEQIRERPPDIVLLDLMLPRLNGLDVLRSMRLDGGGMPVIILSAKASERERIEGLKLGADDYVVKPYSPAEVVARVHAVLRRAGGAGGPRLAFGELEIDPLKREVTLAGEPVHTTRREFELLHLLASHPGRTYGRAQLLELVWGYLWAGASDTVTVHVRRLRAKIERDPSSPVHLVTVHGVGYRFDP